MKRVIAILFFSAFSLSAANTWYVAREATGSNTGTSWANAWTNFNAIVWSSVQAGDTINVSGGPAGGTNFYIGDLTDNGVSRNDGTRANPVTIPSTEPT